MNVSQTTHQTLFCILIGTLLICGLVRPTSASLQLAQSQIESHELNPSVFHSYTNWQPLPLVYEFEVPYYQQLTSVWCGPAALEMLFDYYGPNIAQSEIALAAATDSLGTYTSDMIRAAHYSYLSDTTDIPPDGFGMRQFGFPAYWHQWSGSYESISSSVKTLLLNDIPLLVLTYYDTSHSAGHYRVLKGYNDTSNNFILHDPWYSGIYQGPNETIDQTLLINNLWLQYSRWGMIIQPWTLDITSDTSPILPNQNFTITADITCPCPDPFSRSQYPISAPTANLTLPANFTIVSGPSPSLDLSSETSSIHWTCQAPSLFVNESCEIAIEIYGSVSGVGVNAGAYTDMIGVNGTISIPCTAPPPPPFLYVEIVIVIIIIAIVILVIIYVVRRRKNLETASL
ncbi:MAG: C39 family peptidase [Candidatus Thorarchaeota archaeon]